LDDLQFKDSVAMELVELESRTKREQRHFDETWKNTPSRRIHAALSVPGVADLNGKRVLICSCGSGLEHVMAANGGADVYAVDVSPVAVRNANRMAEFNGVRIQAMVMDLHSLGFPDDHFDLVYGSAILHHLDCKRAGAEMHRCLKPGGIAFFRGETSDRNPILAFFYRAMSRRSRDGHWKRLLLLQRRGTQDERMLSSADLEILSRQFSGRIRVSVDDFMFFQKASHVMRNRLLSVTALADQLISILLPFLKQYGYEQDVWLQKQA
jgi:SAM-dependent methyltransferase